jgi:hypothetical protein
LVLLFWFCLFCFFFLLLPPSPPPPPPPPPPPQARAEHAPPQAETGKSTALVLADRSLVIRAAVQREYPVTRAARTTYSGTGYGAGYEKGQRADLGTRRVTRPASPSLTRSGG